jgi:hypothetical protein
MPSADRGTSKPSGLAPAVRRVRTVECFVTPTGRVVLGSVTPLGLSAQAPACGLTGRELPNG